MKKTTIIFSFLLIAVFSVGNYLLHLAYLENYKANFKEYIITHNKESVLTNIDIKSSELYVNSPSLVWEDDNQEIVYKGKLYDIITIKRHGAYTTISIASDNQEMALKKEFSSIYDLNSNCNTKKPFELLKTFLMLKYLVNTTNINFSYSDLHSISHATDSAFLLTSVVITLDTPPPNRFI